MMNTFLTLEDVKDVCYEYARARLSYDEPIPSFETRYPNALESALAAPQNQIGGVFAHANLAAQAAVLFYEMVKLHPFLNGNKRIACVSLLTFLSLNGFWLKTSWKELYDIAVTVAGSRTVNREGVRGLLTDFIENHLVSEHT